MITGGTQRHQHVELRVIAGNTALRDVIGHQAEIIGDASAAIVMEADDIDPVGRSSCNGSGATFCCCYWDGPWWGCACSD